jgi:flavin-dependent dehydrogenase
MIDNTPSPATSSPQGIPPQDVAIVGGGAAGLTLAMQLIKARPGTSVVVVERERHSVPEAAHKVGESTVEIAGHYLREVLDLGPQLQDRQLNKFGLRVFFSEGDNEDITRRVELGHAMCPPHGVGTYQIDRGRFENDLGQELVRRGVTFWPGSRVRQVELAPEGEFHRLRVTSGDDDAEREILARWVVDGTGRSSLLKRQLGLVRKVGHEANAVWFRIAHPIDLEDWSGDPSWHNRIREGERRLSTNHLMGEGYWVWLIPLASDSISIGIVSDPAVHPFNGMNRLDRALTWLREHEPQCARAVEQHQDKLLDFRVMKDYAYSSAQVYSEDRWCLAGEAAVFLDPLYSPGLDLIAIGNGLITDLVTRSLDGEDISEVAAIHNQVFFLVADGWLRIYENQYPIMGNPRVMMAKVIWDTAVYWAVPGLLYFQDTFRSLIDHPSIMMQLARFSAMSEHVQRFFREWSAFDASSASDTFVSFYDFDFMARLHIGMTAKLSDQELERQFADNVEFISRMSGQLVSAVIAECAANTSDERSRRQAELWRADEHLAELVDVYEKHALGNGFSDGWITLKHTVGAGAKR